MVSMSFTATTASTMPSSSPRNISLGTTRNPRLVEEIGRATAEEVSCAGINWDFAPCLCVARNDRWGRTYESFGEVPQLATQMTSIVTGLPSADQQLINGGDGMPALFPFGFGLRYPRHW
jgi:beta-glucosidase-like glycosyl hydrolase